jgi:hypothetical protein
MAWTSRDFDDGACSWCGERPVDCSPWGGDGRAWFHARMAYDDGDTGRRKADAVAGVRYRPDIEHRRSLCRGIVARGNTSARLSSGAA